MNDTTTHAQHGIVYAVSEIPTFGGGIRSVGYVKGDRVMLRPAAPTAPDDDGDVEIYPVDGPLGVDDWSWLALSCLTPESEG